jgi:hypothetical protein
MYQCVILALKVRYMNKMMREMMHMDSYEFAHDCDTKKCIDYLSTSWDEIKVSTLKNARSKIGFQNSYLFSVS